MDGIRGVIHMLYRRLRRRKIRFNTYGTNRRPLPLAQRIIIFLTICFLVLAAAVSIILIQLRPLMVKLAKTMVTDVLMLQVNDVIEQEILKGSFDYTKLVTFEKDTEGNITAIIQNTTMINTLSTKISSGVYRKVDDQAISDLEIPIGNAIGGVLFSGHGPKFKIKILSIADVNTAFSDSFEEVGINQTRHKIYLDITVEVNMMIPGHAEDTVIVSDQVAVCNYVIVGKVPDTYADIGCFGGNS
jgi:sporulation protein YunB